MANEENYDYLKINQEDKTVISNLAEMGEKLKTLKTAQLAAEAAADAAKKAYDHYANVIIPQEMAACGVDSLSLKSGGKISLKHNFYCQPNKNAQDRAEIVKWLRCHGGAHLVEHDATVSADDFEKLEASGIPYVENTVVNTTRLKAFLKAGVTAEGGTQQFTMEDIPSCAHFQEVTSVDISL